MSVLDRSFGGKPGCVLRVCFVCAGNICRSPTAEGILRHLLKEVGLMDSVLVQSAGTGDWHVGQLADPRTRKAALARGYALDRRAQHFTREFFRRFDLILVADLANLAHVKRMAPNDEARSKVRLIRDFDPASPPNSEVPDPYYGGPEGFEEVLDICEAACRGLVAHLSAEVASWKQR